jgi:hypothetical protein
MSRETDPLWRLLLGVLFLTQSWGHTSLLSNEAYWSLPYEFWYYAIFAATTFLKGWQRIVVLIASCAVAGPGILIMAPIWAAGAVAYRLAKRAMLGQAVARTIWIAAGVGPWRSSSSIAYPIPRNPGSFLRYFPAGIFFSAFWSRRIFSPPTFCPSALRNSMRRSRNSRG